MCLADDGKQGGNLDGGGSPEVSALLSDLLFVDTWRVAHPGAQAWNYALAITTTRIDLILTSCAAAAADMSVAPLSTDHRLVSATFGKPTASCKRFFMAYAPSVLADEESCAAVRYLLESNCVLVDYAGWSRRPKRKRVVANLLSKSATNAARGCNDAPASAKQELARATAAVFTSASPMNLRAGTESDARVHACHVARLQEVVCTFEASAFASVARPRARQRP